MSSSYNVLDPESYPSGERGLDAEVGAVRGSVASATRRESPLRFNFGRHLFKTNCPRFLRTSKLPFTRKLDIFSEKTNFKAPSLLSFSTI